MSKFKAGDRVRMRELSGYADDYGTIGQRHEDSTTTKPVWWVKWDDLNVLWVDESDIKKVKDPIQKAQEKVAKKILKKLLPYVLPEDADLGTHELAALILDRVTDDLITA